MAEEEDTGVDAGNEEGQTNDQDTQAGGQEEAYGLLAATMAAQEGETEDGESQDAAEGEPVWAKNWQASENAAKGALPATAKKFWDGEKGQFDGVKMAKAYAELEADNTRLRSGKGGSDVPDSADGYFDDWEMPEGVVNVPFDPGTDPVAKSYATHAHELGIGKKQAMELFKRTMADLDEAAPAGGGHQRIDYDAELEKLGPNGKRIAGAVGTYLSGLQRSGEFSDAEIQELQIAAVTAEGISALNKLRMKAGEKPVHALDSNLSGLSLDEWQAKIKDVESGKITEEQWQAMYPG